MTEHTTHLQAWLNEMGRQQGTNFTLDEQGRCFIKANDETSLCLFGIAGSDHFYINVELIEVPVTAAENLFKCALSLNLFQQETRGATIAFDDQANMLMLCYSGSYESNSFQDFSNVLNNMIDLTASLKPQLQESLSDHAQGSAPLQETAPFMHEGGLRL
ncbi:type III secretion system chaperone [Thalassomonas viridans]|uniref:Type III secretion system chaperone n=1 Tax=Thalassomonas viridans TaxID=137584 RepID=A0AAE9Z9R4_9GAMM|nr:CesT family type III secretion system chaperone [Thalassomonas viridans]WDE08645.1 type III secretion system chaperone [Thalassomonas viridans]